MKIYIGPHKNFFGCYQLADLLQKVGVSEDSCYKIGTALASDKLPFDRFFQWVDSKRKQKVKIRIDKYDTWNMDDTLSMIILPMLKQLKATQHGSPFVDDKDVPKELRRSSASDKPINDWETDSNWDKRWEWVMDEMIYAFESECDSWAAEQKFSSGVFDMKSVPTTTKAGSPAYTFVKGPNHTHKTDEKGLKDHHKRVKNGLRLFGRYYQNLWD